MASVTTNIFKENSELCTSAVWNLIHGDIVKFLENDEFEEVIIFERDTSNSKNIMSASPLNRSNLAASQNVEGTHVAVSCVSATADIKGAHDSKQIRPVYIVLKKQPVAKIFMEENKTSMKRAWEKVIEFYLLLGNGDRILQTSSNNRYSFINRVKLFDIREEEVYKTFLCGAPFEQLSAYCNKLETRQRIIINFESAHNKLCEKGRLQTNSHLGFVIGEMSDHMLERLFVIFQKFNVLNQMDIEFLKAIVKPRDRSEAMTNLHKQMMAACNTKQFQSAVDLAKKIHEISREEAVARGTIHSIIDANKIKPMFFDDCDASFKLGEFLENISPLHAISAFEISSKDEYINPIESVSFKTLYKNEAFIKIQNIKICLSNTSGDERHQRKFRREVMKVCLLNLGTPGFSFNNEGLHLFIKLLEKQAGCDHIRDNRLFKKLSANPKSFMASIDVFFEIMDAMAEKLYEQKKASSLQVTAADVTPTQQEDCKQINDHKSQIDKKTQSKLTDAAAAAMVNTASAIAVTATVGTSEITTKKSLTHLKNRQDEKSLQEGSNCGVLPTNSIPISEINCLMGSTWNLIHGDIVKFLQNDEVEDIVVFERKVKSKDTVIVGGGNQSNSLTMQKSGSINATISQNSPTTDQKLSFEAEQLRPVYVVLQRQDKLITVLEESKACTKPSGKKVIEFYLILGNGDKINNCASLSEFYQSCRANFFTQREECIYGRFSCSNPFMQSSREHESEKFRRSRKNFHCAESKLREEGRLHPNRHLGFVSSEMPVHILEHLLATLLRINLFNESDMHFLRAIIKPRDYSEAEVDLREQMIKACNTQEFPLAVDLAKKIHEQSKKEAIARGTTIYSYVDVNKIRLAFFDDCDVSFKLGEYLELISPFHAIAALEISCKDEYAKTSEDNYFSMLYREEANIKIRDINIALSGTSNDVGEQRKFRKEAMKGCLLNLVVSDDLSLQDDAFRLLTKLLETHAGFDNFGNNRLFEHKVINIVNDLHSMNLIFEILDTMADKLYNQNKDTSLLATSGDLKANQEGSTQQIKDHKSQSEKLTQSKLTATAASQPTAGASTSENANSASLTYLKDMHVAKSLEEDDVVSENVALNIDANKSKNSH